MEAVEGMKQCMVVELSTELCTEFKLKQCIKSIHERCNCNNASFNDSCDSGHNMFTISLTVASNNAVNSCYFI